MSCRVGEGRVERARESALRPRSRADASTSRSELHPRDSESVNSCLQYFICVYNSKRLGMALCS